MRFRTSSPKQVKAESKPKPSLFATIKRVGILERTVATLRAAFRDERENPVIGFIRTCGAVCGMGALCILLAFFITKNLG
jgi:hypothetical protein